MSSMRMKLHVQDLQKKKQIKTPFQMLLMGGVTIKKSSESKFRVPSSST